MRTLKTIFFVLYLVIICFETATPWWRRRRRRRYSPPPCDKSECIVSDWSARGSCSLRCGLKGYQLFERRVLVRQGSCGSCHYALTDWRPCNKEPWRCRNYSRQKNYGCICRGGWTGTCCELGEFDRHTHTHTLYIDLKALSYSVINICFPLTSVRLPLWLADGWDLFSPWRGIDWLLKSVGRSFPRFNLVYSCNL